MTDDPAVMLREATAQDADFVVASVRAMLHDMASYGGHVLADDDQITARLSSHFWDSLEKEDHVCLLAHLQGGNGDPIGMIEASMVQPYDIFQAKAVLHIRSAYVMPGRRGQGVGRRLLEAVLEWGKERGCVEAELNTLVGNPARSLYKSMGFEVFELEMRLRL
jgi:GNAT superfamily N-acetyltransferase